MLKIIPFEKHSGKENMQIDLSLFNDFESSRTSAPTLRLYGWKKHCISLGYSQDPEKELFLDNCIAKGIEVVKRPTGGGIVFHNEHELTYSIVCAKDDPRLPKGLISSYKAISVAIIEALKTNGVPAELSNTRKSGFARLCFSFPASYEITLQGKKVVGSAQKRGKRAFLQQGSIFIKNDGLDHGRFIKKACEYDGIEDILDIKIDTDKLGKAIVGNVSNLL